MPVTVTDKIVALLASLTNQQIEDLPPAERRRLADQCLEVAHRAHKAGRTGARAGVLLDLSRGGHRGE